jgi:hypothetical protein
MQIDGVEQIQGQIQIHPPEKAGGRYKVNGNSKGKS